MASKSQNSAQAIKGAMTQPKAVNNIIAPIKGSITLSQRGRPGMKKVQGGIGIKA